jgi:integrase
VFPNRAGDRPPPNFDAAWNALRRRAGLEDVRLHDLRHSFASIAIAHGESAAIVGRLLGHALPESTQRYIHFAREDVGRAATRIAGRLARALGERETGDGQA